MTYDGAPIGIEHLPAISQRGSVQVDEDTGKVENCEGNWYQYHRHCVEQEVIPVGESWVINHTPFAIK